MSSNQLTILLVEDDPQDAFLLRKNLIGSDAGPIEIVHAARLSEGLARLDEGEFDAIVLDMLLPDSQGLATLVAVHNRAPRTPIVVITGLNDKDLALQAVRQGAQDYLIKGKLSPDLLANSIRYAIERNALKVELKEQMQLLQVDEERFRHLIETHADGVLVVDGHGVVLLANSMASFLLSRTREELVGKIFGTPLQVGVNNSEIHLLSREREALVAEMRFVETKWDDETVSILSLRDITERKIAEEKTREMLREKEVLLKEVHHRVKNNLQLIISLLNMQERRLSEETNVRDLFAITQNRIRSMALIHERLYKNESLAQVDFAVYIRTLVNELFSLYAQDPGRVALQLSLQDAKLDIDTAVPCGLIVNELVTNALKYAFPGDRQGTIGIDLTQDESGLILKVVDDGVGIPSGFDIDRNDSMGLRLVQILTNQLQGEWTFDSNAQGTQVAIVMPALVLEKV